MTLILLVYACGGSSGSPTAKHGGTLTYLSTGDVDSLDPGRTCTEFGYSVDLALNRTLYYYPPGTSQLTPDIASGPPVVSADQMTVTVHLRHGIKFAPPVNREVTSADIKYAMERLYTPQVANCYASIYYAAIVGAPAAPTNYKPLSGIETPDQYTLIFHLSSPVAGGFVPALAMPGTAPVPPEIAKTYDSQSPSEYVKHVAFSGPYMLETYVAGQEIAMVRNPNWAASTDFRPAALDKIVIREGNTDLSVAVSKVLSGPDMACCDKNPPASSLVQANRTPKQVVSQPGGLVDFLQLDPTIKPLNNINIRRAIAAVMNRQALLLAAGGAQAASIGTGFIPPGVPGYAAREGADLDWTAAAQGDMALAKHYMQQAGADGLPIGADGKYNGSENLLIVGVSDDPSNKAGAIIQTELQDLGFHVTLRLVDGNTYFSKFCETGSSTGAAVCANDGIAKDFPDALGILPIFVPGSIAPINSSDVIDAIKAAEATSEGPARADAWAHANELVLQHVISIPYAYIQNVVVTSNNVSVSISPLWSGGSIDFSFAHLT